MDREPADPVVRQVHGGQHVIVLVEEERRTRFHPVEEFELRGKDALPAAEVLDVRDADVGDDADVRQSRLRKLGDLAFMVHAQFEDQGRMFRFETEQDLREADLVVPVFIGLVRMELRVQDTPDHLFGRRLPHTSGERDDRDIIFQPVRLCKVQKRPGRIGHLDGGHFAAHVFVAVTTMTRTTAATAPMTNQR